MLIYFILIFIRQYIGRCKCRHKEKPQWCKALNMSYDSSSDQHVSAPLATSRSWFQLLLSGTDCRHTSHRRRRYTSSNGIWRQCSCPGVSPLLHHNKL